MDNETLGIRIRALRRELGMTQRALAEALGVTDKGGQQMERGLGCPDVSFLPQLVPDLWGGPGKTAQGDLAPNELVGGNMKKMTYYACPVCGNLTFCTGGGGGCPAAAGSWLLWSPGRPGRRRSSPWRGWRTTGSSPGTTPCARRTTSPSWPSPPGTGSRW